MSTVKVYDKKGEEVGTMDVSDSLLVTDRGEQAVRDMVVAYRNAQRAGTASTKTKGEVAGSNAKPWRQKGTGRARAGYRRSPVWRGGGAVFGPRPRSYRVQVNRKVAQLAFRRALSDKLAADEVKVVDSLGLEKVGTRSFAAILSAMGIQGKVLVVMESMEKNTALSARNIAGVELAEAATINVYQLLNMPVLLTDKAGMAALTARLGNGAEASAKEAVAE